LNRDAATKTLLSLSLIRVISWIAL
jgi:hypothetical protein